MISEKKRKIKDVFLEIIQLLDEFKFGFVILSNDVVYDKLSPELRIEIVQFGVNEGKKLALEVEKKYCTNDPIKIAEELNINIKTSGDFIDNLLTSKILNIMEFANYSSKRSIISINNSAITKLMKQIDKLELNQVFKDLDLMKIVVAHEMFHHLDKNKAIGKNFKIESIKWGPIKITTHIHTLREIAGDAFAKNLLKLSYPPKLLDYVALFVLDEEKAYTHLMALRQIAKSNHPELIKVMRSKKAKKHLYNAQTEN